MVDKILKEVEMELENKGIKAQVGKIVTKKNNRKMIMGIAFEEENTAFSTVLYIEDEIENVSLGKLTAEKAAELIVNKYVKDCNSDKRKMAESFAASLTKEKILDSVCYAMVNKNANEYRLDEIPHKEFLDLAVIFKSIIGYADGNQVSHTLTNDLMKRYGISFEELDKSAWKNTKKKSGFKTTNVLDILCGLTGENDMDFGIPPMYVLSNDSEIDGAAVMLYNEYFNRLADELGTNLTVFPSSIHEVIAIPQDNDRNEFFRYMVKQINKEDVDMEEVLSDSVYIYDRAEQRFLIA